MLLGGAARQQLANSGWRCASTGSSSTNPRLDSGRWRADAFGTDIAGIQEADAGKTVTVRGRVARAKITGKVGFITVRQPGHQTLQVVITAPELLEAAKRLTPESIIDVRGTLTKAKVKSATCTMVEVQADHLDCVSLAATPLPLDTTAKLDTRLSHRSMDLRNEFNDAVFRISSEMTRAYRDFMASIGFTEIATPKMLPTPSEGGASVFELNYFGRKAYLAQSPQLYKQMCVMGDMPRVFEVGPVFRAENSNTHRHLTEFVGLDAEMVIRDSYVEVLDVLEACVSHVLQHVQTECAPLVARARAAAPSGAVGGLGPIQTAMDREHPLFGSLGCDSAGSAGSDKYGARIGNEDLPALRMSFDHAMRLLVDRGEIDAPADDFNTAMEKALGRAVKDRYGVDLLLCDRYPSVVRPFYTQRCPRDDTRTLSYDLLLRGEEICSGAQRLHDMALLAERATAAGVELENIRPYIDCFAHGAWPHGGFGLGQQRMVMLFLGLPDVRWTTHFPRDPSRITP